MPEEEQEEAVVADPAATIVGSDAPRIRVRAGPGTGKSYNLKERARRLLTAGVAGRRIFAVTYTRAAAAELVAKLQGLGVPGAEDIKCSTLHSYAFSLLARRDVFEHLNRAARPLWDIEYKFLISDLAPTNGGKNPAKASLKALSADWARLQSEQPGWPQNQQDAHFLGDYLRWMGFHQAMHIDELIPLAVHHLRANPADAALAAFEHVLVDEFQDLNRADQELVNMLGRDASMMIIGDADQSIYSFRYAHPEGIQEWLEGQTPEPKEDPPLTVCRRCPQRVVRMARALIEINPAPDRAPLAPYAPNPEGLISVLQWSTRDQETKGAARAIHHLLETDQVPPAQKILVIVPYWDWGEALEEHLTNMGRQDVQLLREPVLDADQRTFEAISLLKLRLNPGDRVALRCWLGADHGTLATPWTNRLMDYCLGRNADPFQVLQAKPPDIFTGCQRLYDRYELLVDRLGETTQLTVTDFVKAVLPNEGALGELRWRLLAWLEQHPDGEGFDSYVQEVMVRPEPVELEARVTIMTPFKAKGLTAHTVFVLGAVRGAWPMMKPGLDAQERLRKEQEGRRLFYVAVTRPTHRLVISSFQKLRAGDAGQVGLALRAQGHWVYTQASRYVEELGPEKPVTQTGSSWLNNLLGPGA